MNITEQDITYLKELNIYTKNDFKEALAELKLITEDLDLVKIDAIMEALPEYYELSDEEIEEAINWDLDEKGIID